MLNREQILSCKDKKVVKVDVPEWQDHVYITTMSSRDRDAVEAATLGDNGQNNYENLRARMVVKCLCDESGKLLFSEADAKALGEKSALAINRIFNECQKINGFTEEDIEELAKN